MIDVMKSPDDAIKKAPGGSAPRALEATTREQAEVPDTSMLIPLRQGSKRFRILSKFATGEKLHRLEAAKYGDSVLNSTVSILEKRCGIRFQRKLITVTNRFGGNTRVNVYWLTGQSLETARILCGLGGD